MTLIFLNWRMIDGVSLAVFFLGWRTVTFSRDELAGPMSRLSNAVWLDAVADALAAE